MRDFYPFDTKGFSESPGVNGKGFALELPFFYEQFWEPSACCAFAFHAAVRVLEDGDLPRSVISNFYPGPTSRKIVVYPRNGGLFGFRRHGPDVAHGHR
jgi:hypothetical protein